MKKNLRGKIREYIASEDGKVGVKSPLTLGVAAGGLLLAQAMLPSVTQAATIDDSGVTCDDDSDCTVLGEICRVDIQTYWPGPTIVISSECVIPDD